MIIILLFIFGLIIGSFLNCLLYRLVLPKFSLKNLGGRSYCPICKHILAWPDLFPVFSFIFLRGKCRYCQKKISWQYPLIELATAVLFVITGNYLGITLLTTVESVMPLIYYLLIISCLIVIFVFDLRHYLIPDEIVYSAIAVSGIWYLVFRIIPFYTKYKIQDTKYILFNEPMAAIGACLFFLAIYLVTKGRGLGFGDVKLGFLMGMVLGFPKIIVALFFAFLTGALAGLILIILKKKQMKSELPFAPFLVSGTFFALFFGQVVIDYYLGFLLP